MSIRHHRARGPALLLSVGLVAAVTGLSTTATTSATAAPGASARPAAPRTEGSGDHRGFYDARQGVGSAARAAVARRAARAAARPATRRLTNALGDGALVDIDGTTGTPRLVARLDGFLTGPSRGAPAATALGYVRAHLAPLGLSSADLGTLRLRRDYTDVAGVHHLSWTQRIGGDEVFGNGLQAAVTRDGRLVSLGGSPVHGADPAPGGSRVLGTADEALSAARRSQGDSATPGPRDRATRVLFVTRSGTHLGWAAVTMSSTHPTQTVLDAHTGAPLYRRPLSADADSPEPGTGAGGRAYRYFPRARVGGVARPVDYTDRGWLAPGSPRLAGNNSHTYSDVNDDDLAQGSEEVAPSSPDRWDYPLVPFHLPDVSFCDAPYPCSWNPDVPYSWRVNRAQNAAQVFFFVNNWHDHLLRRPIGFTEAAGNFQVRNRTGKGAAGDAVDTQTDDGANTDAGLPDGSHIDNANMETPPDGQAPTMQMYLQHQPGTSYPDGDPFAPTNVGDEADTVYHEYTHGLSNRLVVDAGGSSTLGGVQAGSMGEAWSDWYAMDFLVDQGYQQDRPGTADVVLFQYDGEGVFLDRTEPIDCAVGSSAPRCTGGTTGHTGGYTYADYGNVVGGPEVHGDGEIWSQTLWDLRDALGSSLTESLVTRAMELSPGNPSFLDERNALLLADRVVRGGRDAATIWRVFAHRGMGYYAGSLGGDDTTPAADFHTPPASVTRAPVSGTVRDAGTGEPLAGVTVSLAFQGAAGPVNPSDVTDADGRYRIPAVPVGTYGKFGVSGAGYVTSTGPVTVRPGGTTKSFSVQRDYAAASGGASVSSFNGPDYTPFGCGPEAAIDLSQGTGWSSTAGDDDGDPTGVFVPKHIVVDLSEAVDVSGFAVDPSATCGDGGSASTGAYRIETSTDGTTWTEASSGTFTSDDNGRLNPLTPAAGSTGVRHVRFTILGNQTPSFSTNCPDGAYSGCSYADLTELEVFGTPAA